MFRLLEHHSEGKSTTFKENFSCSEVADQKEIIDVTFIKND